MLYTYKLSILNKEEEDREYILEKLHAMRLDGGVIDLELISYSH